MGFMCNKCYSIYNEGNICSKCNSKLIEIDNLLTPIVSMLNKKGYKTLSCCSGHNDNHPTNKTYIKFQKEYEPKIIPNGFKIRKDDYQNTIIYRYHPKPKCKDELEKSIFKSVIDLFNWSIVL
jgi:hypothetical protein